MDVPRTRTKKPLTLSILLFLILAASTITASIFLDFSNVDVAGLLFMTAFACAALISKSVYDSLSLNDQIARTHETISADIEIASEELHTQLYQNSPIPYLLLNKKGEVISADRFSK